MLDLAKQFGAALATIGLGGAGLETNFMLIHKFDSTALPDSNLNLPDFAANAPKVFKTP